MQLMYREPHLPREDLTNQWDRQGKDNDPSNVKQHIPHVSPNDRRPYAHLTPRKENENNLYQEDTLRRRPRPREAISTKGPLQHIKRSHKALSHS